MNLVLCGMPASGKSTVAAVLQQISGRRAVDTDSVIVERYGAIPALFERYGEAYFRRLETEVVSELAKQTNLIIATGGGTLLSDANVSALKQNGRIVYLSATLSTLLKRSQKSDDRPLIAGDKEQKLKALYTARIPVYQNAADFTIETDDKTVEQIAQSIWNWEKETEKR